MYRESNGTYGRPRVHAALVQSGVSVGQRRVGRLMRCMGLRGVTRRRFRSSTERDPAARPAPDLVERDFHATRPNQLWVADMTELPMSSGRQHLAVILDVWSRRVVGWSMASHKRAEVVQDALSVALATRSPEAKVIHHSDQGSQYTSSDFRLQCKAAGVTLSMGSVGDAYDNALCESFFATLKCELTAGRRFSTAREARREVFAFIDGYYNTSYGRIWCTGPV